MNSLVFAIVLCASACLADVSHVVNQPIAIVRDDKDVAPDGSFSYEYETQNGIKANAQGNSAGAVQGNFQWTAPDGTPVQIVYTADENGYQAQGNAVPTPPPIPQSVIRTLEYIAAHPYKEEPRKPNKF